ncbi:Chromosome_segregation ATPase [Hexamita inflata]|uniref:Structural maintenance of chromosomes protein n=1 Tax=Hexamita inflata TaxID=28002 RepID=A0AA86UTL5_9EUKA|nr:Chromosome segregation ATPase [Hexamita inflata]
MYLEEIVLDGFKSYAQLTRIQPFNRSFTAITGLNGSGKSNVLDAICFVLGISSLSRIRVGQLTDLIYKQGQAGVTKASVSLVFNNSDQAQSPQGYETIPQLTITRQVFSNGTTKYLLNDQTAKQKTIKQLFQSTGLNINNPNFLIMQGRIQAILSMKPVELLSILEETAGTLMYDQNKKEAEKTFDQKELRLNQIRKTIREEIQPRIQQLDKERQLGVQICQIQKGLKGFDILKQIQLISEEIMAIQQAEFKQQEQITVEQKIRSEMLSLEQQLQETQLQLSEIQPKDVDSKIVVQMDVLVNQIAVLEQQISHLTQKSDEVNAHTTKKQSLIQKLINKQQQLKTEIQQTEQHDNSQQQINQLQQILNENQAQKTYLETQLDLIKTGSIDENYLDQFQSEFTNQFKKDLFKGQFLSINELVSKITQKKIQIEQEMQQNQLELTRINGEKINMQNLLIDEQQRDRQFENQIATVKRQIESQFKQMAQITNKQFDFELNSQNLNEFKQFIEEMKIIINKVKQTNLGLSQKEKQHQQNFKQQKQSLFQKFAQTSGSGPQMINMVQNTPQEYGLMGTVLDFVDINEEALGRYNQFLNGKDPQIILQAAEQMVGGRLFNLVFKEVKQASQFMKSQYCKSRCTALPLDNIEAYPATQSRVNLLHQYKGILVSEIICPSDVRLQKVFDNLFGSLAIAPTLKDAREIAYDDNCKFKCITLDFDIVDPFGVVSGGSKHVKQDSTIQAYKQYVAFDQQVNYAQEIQQNEDYIQNLSKMIQPAQQNLIQYSVESERHQQSSKTNTVINQIEEATKQLVQLQQSTQKQHSLQQYLIVLIQNATEMQAHSQQNALNEKDIQQNIIQLNQAIKKYTEQLTSLKQQSNFDQFEQKKIELMAIQQEIEAHQQLIQENNDLLITNDSQVKNLNRDLKRYQDEKQQLQSQILAQNKEKTNLSMKIQTLSQKCQELESQIQKHQSKHKLLIQQNRDMQTKLETQLKSFQAIMDQNLEYFQIVEVLNKQAFEAVRQRFKPKFGQQLQLKHLCQYISDSNLYDLNIPENAQIQQLQKLVPDAPQIINQLNQQLNLLQQQNQTVTTTTANLEELQKSARQLIQMEQKLLVDKEKIINLIQQVDNKKTAALEELFIQVNTHMKKIFNILLPNSSAQLEKVGSDIIKGVQFKIQLGTTNTTLSGLSGGQKSLLALSFTLALLECKPSPIYILDEIDAALDLSHTHSIGRLIQQEFKGSQFIIVSLKEGMFNHANQLFKVRFQDGMSRVEAAK